MVGSLNEAKERSEASASAAKAFPSAPHRLPLERVEFNTAKQYRPAQSSDDGRQRSSSEGSSFGSELSCDLSARAPSVGAPQTLANAAGDDKRPSQRDPEHSCSLPGGSVCCQLLLLVVASSTLDLNIQPDTGKTF